MSMDETVREFNKDEEPKAIWNHLCLYAKERLLQRKGIKFSNIGTFCFTLCEVPPEAGIIGKIKRPIFILSEKICYTHLVSQGRRSIEGSIPVVNLNICELSLKTNFPKHRIEKCLDEVLFTVNQYLHQEKAIEILFTDIGWLRIDKRRAKFRFFRSFLLEFEKSGALIQALKNRPGTCDSVITSVSNKSHGSSRTAKLTTNILGPIVEESNPGSFGVEKENILKLGKTIPSSSNQSELPDPGGSARTAITISSVRYIEPSPTLEVNGIEEENEQNYTQETESHELPEDIHIDGEGSKDADEEDVVGPQNTLDRQADSAAADCATYGGSRWLSMPKLPSFNGANLDFTTVSSQTTEEKRLQSSATLSVSSHASSKPSTTGSSRERRKHLSEKFRALQTRCSHTQKYGQELCYICHQREARNIPVDMKEEIRHQEEAEEELFRVYQRMRAESSLKKEQEAALTRKADLKKQAAYNRGVADAKQMKRGYRDETGYKTFIFSDRAPTPPAIVKQTEMRTNLDEQTKLRVDEQQRLKDVEDEAGREEQAKLAMELRIQRRQEFDDKVARQRKYKHELDKQIQEKEEQITGVKEDNSDDLLVFGAAHYDQKSLLDKLNLKKQYQTAQMQAAEKRVERLKEDRVSEVEREKLILKRAHEDLVCDQMKKREAQQAMKEYFETEWKKAIQEKLDRDKVDLMYKNLPSELTLHEQCDGYRRCNQCKRRLENMGQWNLVTDNFAKGMPYVR